MKITFKSLSPRRKQAVIYAKISHLELAKLYHTRELVLYIYIIKKVLFLLLACNLPGCDTWIKVHCMFA